MSIVTSARTSSSRLFRVQSWPAVTMALLCVVAAIVVEWQYGPLRRYRIPSDWSLRALSIGTQTNADPVTRQLPENETLGEYVRSITILPPWRPDTTVVEDRLTIRDLSTGAVTWEYAVRMPVDPHTGQHLDPRYRGEIELFPREVQRREYRYRNNYVPGLPMTFQRVDTLGGLETWVFGYHGPLGGEYYTRSYAGTPRFPGVTVEPGQEIRCADDQFSLRIWVEPRTGSQVKLEEGCPAGDFIYDSAGNRLAAVDRWSGVTSGEGLGARIAVVRSVRRKYLTARYVPPGFLVAALLFLLFGVRIRRGDFA